MRRNVSFYAALRRKQYLAALAFILGILGITLLLSSYAKPQTQDELVWMKELEFYKNINRWKFAIISDMDHASKVEKEGDSFWRSWLQKASLIRNPETGAYSIQWDSEKHELKTVINEKGRAMELSDLVKFNGKLYTCDDRTGIVYELIEKENKVKAIPRHILMDGDGDSSKGFKCEWGTVKGDKLYIGSFGKEFTNSKGEPVNNNPMWVKVIDTMGTVTHTDWSKAFSALRIATNTPHPGYLFHESCQWHPILKRWFFLPRRESTEPYEPTLDEQKGSNVLISTNENFEDVQVKRIGEIIAPTRGFSAFRFIPGRPNEILAIKSEEVGSTAASFMLVFNLDGKVLLEEHLIYEGVKYEGLEFL